MRFPVNNRLFSCVQCYCVTFPVFHYFDPQFLLWSRWPRNQKTTFLTLKRGETTDRLWNANDERTTRVCICQPISGDGGRSEGSQNDPQRVKRGSKPAHDTCLLHNRALSYFIVIIEPYGLNGICARQLSNNTPRSLPNWGTKRGQNFVLTLLPPRSPQNFTQRYISSLLIVLFTL